MHLNFKLSKKIKKSVSITFTFNVKKIFLVLSELKKKQWEGIVCLSANAHYGSTFCSSY